MALPKVRAHLGVLGQVLHFRLTDEDDIDAELITLLRDAYRVGA